MPNFGGLQEKYCSYKSSAIVIIPVPYDGTSTWIKGSDKGPEAILEASMNMELYDIETDSEVYLRGIHTLKSPECPSDPGALAGIVKKRVSNVYDDNKFPVVIGGEHSVSIGAIQASADKFKNLTVLQIDAHADLREEYEGSKFNHACVMARAKEISPVVQVGIRSMCIEEKKDMDTDNVFFAKDIVGRTEWTENVIDRLTQNVYVTIDLDVFDPAIMPSTGTPEPGGLFWYDVINLLKKVGEERDIVGFDVVELCPDKNNRAPDFTAAKLVYSLLSYVYKNRK